MSLQSLYVDDDNNNAASEGDKKSGFEVWGFRPLGRGLNANRRWVLYSNARGLKGSPFAGSMFF